MKYDVKQFAAKRKKYRVCEVESRKNVLLRIYLVSVICFLGFTIIFGRAFYLHLVDNKDLEWIAKKQYNAKVPISVRRGKIFDRNGEELAISLPVPSIYVDPKLIENPKVAAKELARKLNLKTEDVLKKIESPKRFAWIKRRISYDALKEVMLLDIAGVNYIEESKRFYPNGELASQVLGAVGYDSQALAGIELAHNDILISKKRSVSYKRDAKGRLYAAPVRFEDQQDVGSVYLTIDKQIQFIAETALRNAVEKHKAVNGIAVVMDPNNGDILAMANSPIFDPNRYSKYPIANWKNRVVTDAFEPGSTFKVLVVASALNAGTITKDTVYDCENGSIRIGRDVLRDSHAYEKLAVEDIIKHSSNIGTMKIAYDLGKDTLYNSLKMFGIGELTGINYPGEVSGIFRDYRTWQPVEQATVAFGQGLTVTPLQMTVAFSSTINGGYYYKPKIVGRIAKRNGVLKEEKNKAVINQIITEDASNTVRYLLKRVVEQGGTGVNAFSEAYSIGGKTGTAQKVVANGKGYAKGKYFSSFIGFAPVENPKLVVFVGLDEPVDGHYGGTVAAPSVKEIIERSLNYMGVPSKKMPEILTVVNKNRDMELKDIKKLHENAADNKTRFKKDDAGMFVMPDLTGLTLREVMVSASNASLEVLAEGVGVVVAQKPFAGAVVKNDEKFSVKFDLP